MSISPEHRRAFALLGALPIIWILTASAVFGVGRPENDATHAISELGQQGSANAVAWNVLGFGGVALLYALYAIPIAAEFGRKWLFALVVLQMITTAGSGVFSCDPGCQPVMSMLVMPIERRSTPRWARAATSSDKAAGRSSSFTVN
jgi:hypothetical protein